MLNAAPKPAPREKRPGKTLQTRTALKQTAALKPGKPPKRTKPIAYRSKRPSAVARQKADKAWREETLRKYGGVCILGLPGCAVRGRDPMHLYRKTSHAEYRHEPWAGAPGCRSCHTKADTDPDLQAVLHQVADLQRAWHEFRRVEPVTVEEIRQLVREGWSRGNAGSLAPAGR